MEQLTAPENTSFFGKQKPMEQGEKNGGVTHGEIVGAGLVLIGAMLMFWKTTDVRLSALEIRINEIDKYRTEMSTKLDNLQEGINDVKLTLKDKVDRK